MPSDYLVAISVQLLWKAESDTCLTEAVACWAVAFGQKPSVACDCFGMVTCLVPGSLMWCRCIALSTGVCFLTRQCRCQHCFGLPIVGE